MRTESSLVAPKFLAVDFFCGAGGATRGLIEAGGYVCAGIDNERKCELTYVTNNPNLRGDRSRPSYLALDLLPATSDHPGGQQAEVRDRVAPLLQNLRARWPGLPLFFSITAPCQPFTKLAKSPMTLRRREARRRDSSLLLESARFVEWFQPDIVFAENVAGIRAIKYGAVLQSFEERLTQLGYLLGSGTVCASKFGIPQFRKRAVLLAIRRAKLAQSRSSVRQIPIPEGDPTAKLVTVREAIGHLPPVAAGKAHPLIPNHRARALSRTNLKRIAASIPGESNQNMHSTQFGDLSLNCHADLAERQQEAGFTDVYTRMHPDRPAPTITTRCISISNGRYGHYDPSQARGITPHEAAVLQSFPENYVFYPSEQTAFAALLIGNAVPPKLVRFFAEYAISLLGLSQQDGLNTNVERQAQLHFGEAR